MGGRKWYEWLLTLVFVLMLIICIALNVSPALAGDFANVIVNVVMFILVFLIFISCEVGSFFPANRMIQDLEEATTQILKDAENAAQYLWESYKSKGDGIFSEPALKKRYGGFLREMRRIQATGKGYYRCDIEEFLSPSMTDEIMHRNVLNQVAGALTGLGILGTFVGLSIGLQSFATGSTQEITDSIGPLMGGIKVAFHTSIYGMVFSLVFNYVYKRKLEELEEAIRDFLDAYRKYVLPDAESDVVNALMDVQHKQLEAIKDLANTIAGSLAEGMTKLMTPQFEKFDETIKSFAEGAEKNQMDALGLIVNAFIAEMNKSMHNSFSQLSYTIDQTFLLQQKSSEQLKALLELSGKEVAQYNEWMKVSGEQLKRLQDATVRMPRDAEKTLALLQEALQKSDNHFKEMVRQVEDMTRQVPYTLADTYADVEHALTAVKESIDAYYDVIDRIEQSAEPSRRGNLFGKRG
ncbi:MAG: MotA/TolQ/ExbB proton channel family protein [Lachnospiraceae bacterium]|nr:MotA/TolQ/ExbB proton channel family protein [Lachnospiraceae bacterium]